MLALIMKGLGGRVVMNLSKRKALLGMGIFLISLDFNVLVLIVLLCSDFRNGAH